MTVSLSTISLCIEYDPLSFYQGTTWSSSLTFFSSWDISAFSYTTGWLCSTMSVTELYLLPDPHRDFPSVLLPLYLPTIFLLEPGAHPMSLPFYLTDTS
jgi:hypothetical protein